MKALIRHHAALTYFALTFAISWGGALVAIGGAGGMHGTTPMNINPPLRRLAEGVSPQAR